MKNNGNFKDIDGRIIEKALNESNRQYFVGSLQLPQILEHIDSKDIEIGITDYKNATYENPHWHMTQKEYQYVLSGETTYTNSITNKKYTYKKGDFYAIYPEICYEQLSISGTRILFIKYPAINDKIVCSGCDKVNCPKRLQPYY